MVRVSGNDILAPPATKQLRLAHIAQNAIPSCRQTAALQFGGHRTMTISGHRQRDFLDALSSSLFGCRYHRGTGFELAVTVIARPRDRHRRTELFNGSCAGVVLARHLRYQWSHQSIPSPLFDYVSSSSFAKTFFKRSFSMVRRPTMRSRAAMRASSV